MKIVFVLPNISSGGAERVVTILSDKFIEKGYNVDIVLLIDEIIQYEVSAGVDIVMLNQQKSAEWKLRKYGKALEETPLERGENSEKGGEPYIPWVVKTI